MRFRLEDIAHLLPENERPGTKPSRATNATSTEKRLSARESDNDSVTQRWTRASKNKTLYGDESATCPYLPTEHEEQAALFEWAEIVRFRYPELWGLAAVPNGGARHKKTGRELKAEGVKAGFPDVILPAARQGYHGLFIEMKRRKHSTIGPEQKLWKDYLERQGYRHEFCYGWEEARDVILEYLEGKTGRNEER